MQRTDEERLAYNARQREYMKSYRIRAKEKYNAYRRKWEHDRKKWLAPKYAERMRLFRAKLKATVIAGYGGFCVCCGENEITFLTIDHIVPIRQRYDRGRESHHRLMLRLRKENFPTGYQILCFNCNHAKGTSAECPHRKIFERQFVLLRGSK